MSPVSKARSGVVSVIAALVGVGVFWLIFLPRTEAYKTYRSRTQIKEVLQAIEPPAGATVISLQANHVGDMWFASGAYFTDLKVETLRAHYMKEFSRHGFVYKTEINTKESQTSLEFCRAGYSASLVFSKPERHPETYTIFLYQSEAPC